MKALILRVLGWWLGLANANVGGSIMGRRFYDLKDRLLRKYATRDGSDLQYLKDICWGYADEAACAGKSCRRCGGTGVWSERWIELERWNLGGRIFHRPNGPIRVGVESAKEFARNIIDGRIQHRGVSYRASDEARLWLMLAFDRRMWWSEVRSHRACGWQWMPMHALQSVVFQLRMILDRVRPRTCSCGQTWRPWFDKQGWCICRDCRAGFGRLATADDDDLPF
jgi:hypothetical protein